MYLVINVRADVASTFGQLTVDFRLATMEPPCFVFAALDDVTADLGLVGAIMHIQTHFRCGRVEDRDES
jgi:hypothetical protein